MNGSTTPGRSRTTAHDLSGNHDDGTINGAASTSGTSALGLASAPTLAAPGGTSTYQGQPRVRAEQHAHSLRRQGIGIARRPPVHCRQGRLRLHLGRVRPVHGPERRTRVYGLMPSACSARSLRNAGRGVLSRARHRRRVRREDGAARHDARPAARRTAWPRAGAQASPGPEPHQIIRHPGAAPDRTTRELGDRSQVRLEPVRLSIGWSTRDAPRGRTYMLGAAHGWPAPSHVRRVSPFSGDTRLRSSGCVQSR